MHAICVCAIRARFSGADRRELDSESRRSRPQFGLASTLVSSSYALVGAGAAVVGGLIVAGSNYSLRRLEIRSRERDELRGALVSFLHVLDLIGREAQRQPRPGRTVRRLNHFVERRLPQIEYTTGRLHELIFTPHFASLMDRFALATNRLMLVAPLDLLPRLEAVSDALADFTEPDERWQRRFEHARGELARAAREAVGAEVGERHTDDVDKAGSSERSRSHR